MKFTKIKNFTEINEVRIKTSTSKGEVTNKLVIYIGKEIADKYFSESNYVNVRVVKDKLGKNDIHLFKAIDGSDLRKYKFAVTGNGTCQTRKLLISMPVDVDMNNYIINKSVIYSNIDNTLILHIDSKSKISKKTNKSKLIVNGIDQATLDKQFQNKFNELYDEEYNKYEALGQPITRAVRKARMGTENNIDSITSHKQKRDKLIELYGIREDLDSNNQYHYEELKKLVWETILRLDFLDKKVDFLSPICKAMDRLEDKIDVITSKNTTNETNSKELNNLGYDKLTQDLRDRQLYTEKILFELIEHKNTNLKRLCEIENKVKNIKEYKRSLFDRIFGD
jgi:hypothetical protein